MTWMLADCRERMTAALRLAILWRAPNGAEGSCRALRRNGMGCCSVDGRTAWESRRQARADASSAARSAACDRKSGTARSNVRPEGANLRPDSPHRRRGVACALLSRGPVGLRVATPAGSSTTGTCYGRDMARLDANIRNRLAAPEAVRRACQTRPARTVAGVASRLAH